MKSITLDKLEWEDKIEPDFPLKSKVPVRIFWEIVSEKMGEECNPINCIFRYLPHINSYFVMKIK